MFIHLSTRAPYRPPAEFVERKGPGHPDTLCDVLAETAGNAIARHFVVATGALRHFNVDKALLSSVAVGSCARLGSSSPGRPTCG